MGDYYYAYAYCLLTSSWTLPCLPMMFYKCQKLIQIYILLGTIEVRPQQLRGIFRAVVLMTQSGLSFNFGDLSIFLIDGAV